MVYGHAVVEIKLCAVIKIIDTTVVVLDPGYFPTVLKLYRVNTFSY